MMQASSPSFFQTWIDALTKPNEQTYAGMAASPKAKAMTAYLWVFASSLVASLVSLLVEGATLRNRLAQAGVGAEQFRGGAGSVAITLLCGAPIAAFLGTIVFAVVVALVQWIAKMFGGKGTNDQLAYTFAAIGAPYSLVSSLFIALSAIPFVGLCFRIILAVAGIYIIVLQVMAVKGVNGFGWGPAVGSVFIPALAVLLVCCCAAAIVGALTGAALGNIFSSINSSLVP
jgi:hypothetical protein